MREYEAEKLKFSYSIISGDGSPIRANSTTVDLKSLCINIKFLDSWLKLLEDNFIWCCQAY